MRYKTITVVDHEATGAAWRKIRQDVGFTLRSLARKMGISAPFLSDLERGRRNWTEEIEQTYARHLGVDKALAQACSCHERDSSYACPRCRAEGFRGHMEEADDEG
jgi:transcriptional regulator with XRE-family HTH domain